jgi:hypothetical protein
VNSIPVVPALLFKAATAVLDNLGYSSDRVVKQAGVPDWHHQESHIPIPGCHLYTLVGRAADLLGAEEFETNSPEAQKQKALASRAFCVYRQIACKPSAPMEQL